MTTRWQVSAALVLALLAAAASFARADRVVLVAGGGTGGDGSPATEVKLQEPFGIVTDKATGESYFVEFASRVRKIDAKGVVSTVAGTGEKGDSGDDGPALKAKLNSPHSLILGPDGNLYVADTFNNRVRRINLKAGTISAFAGTGKKGPAADDGPAKEANLGGIYCLAFDPAGTRLILTDLDSRKIRAVDVNTGRMSTLAGNGQKGVPADGAEAAKAPLVDPRAACMDADGNLYILERGGHALRVVDKAGKIHTVVGTGKAGATGDGGPGKAATLNGPKHLCVDADGNVLVADTENHLVRKYVPKDGTIVRVAGTGKKGAGGVGGSLDKVELNRPHGVYVDDKGVLYISDSENGRVLKVEK